MSTSQTPRRPTRRQRPYTVAPANNPTSNPVQFSHQAFQVESTEQTQPVRNREREQAIVLAQPREEDLPQLIIESVIISAFSHDDLIRSAVVKVTNDEPSGQGSVNDPRMGVIEAGKVCARCHKDNMTCPGHLGYIHLNTMVYHPLFFNYIIKVLMSVCNACGGLLLSSEAIHDMGIDKYTGEERLNRIAALSVNLPCISNVSPGIQRCANNPVYLAGKTRDYHQIMYKYPTGGFEEESGYVETQYERPIEEVFAILDAISEEDALTLGFSHGTHPRNFILRSFPVIPPATRPPAFRNGEIQTNQLTVMYQNIIRVNNQLSRLRDEQLRAQARSELAYSIERLIDNTDGKHVVGHLKDYVSIKKLIQGKKALIRKAMMGKRTNYTARTPAGPDPTLKYGQISVPAVWTKFLTIQERVFGLNQAALTDLLRQGQISYIHPAYGRLRGLNIRVTPEIAALYQLQTGDLVSRHLRDGDMVVVGRQPTLHQGSLQAYEVVVRNYSQERQADLWSGLTMRRPVQPALGTQVRTTIQESSGRPLTIGAHLSSTTPHNLDFDGDEMSAYSIQTLFGQAEMRTLMSARECIANGQSNRNGVGIVYDGIVSASLLTSRPDTRVEYHDGQETVVPDPIDLDLYNDCLLLITNQEGLPTLDQRLTKLGVPLRSGRALFSAVLPPDFAYRKGPVRIITGILVSGVITVSHVGPTSGSIVQALYMDYGLDRAVDFLTDWSFVANRWYSEHGFTVGLRDCFPKDPQQRHVLEETIAKSRLAVEALGMNNINNPIEEQHREEQIIGHLNRIRDEGTKANRRYLAPDNNFIVMAESGAKGSESNIFQITGMLGQAFINNERPNPNLGTGGQIRIDSVMGGSRCLPYSERGDLDPEARGLCVNSYLTGLTPPEFFFHQAASRPGLIDTSVKTADTGSIQRKIIKTLEDIKVTYTGAVSNQVGTVFQSVVGGDGFNPAFLEKIRLGQREVLTFINIGRMADRINSRLGFVEPPDTTPDIRPVIEERESEINLAEDIDEGWEG